MQKVNRQVETLFALNSDRGAENAKKLTREQLQAAVEKIADENLLQPYRQRADLEEKITEALAAFKESNERHATQKSQSIDKVNVASMMDEMRAGLKSLQFRLDYSALGADAKKDYQEIKPVVVTHKMQKLMKENQMKEMLGSDVEDDGAAQTVKGANEEHGPDTLATVPEVIPSERNGNVRRRSAVTTSK